MAFKCVRIYKQTIVIAFFLLTLECCDRTFMGRHRECNHFCWRLVAVSVSDPAKMAGCCRFKASFDVYKCSLCWCFGAGFPFVRKEMITTHGLIFSHYIFDCSSSFRSYFTRHAHDHVVFFPSIFNINYGEQNSFFGATIFCVSV